MQCLWTKTLKIQNYHTLTGALKGGDVMTISNWKHMGKNTVKKYNNKLKTKNEKLKTKTEKLHVPLE